MNKATIRSVFLVLIFSLCTNNALAQEFSMYADPENARSIFIFEGGRVVFDDINGTITVGLSSGQNFAFTVDEVAEDIAVNQEHHERSKFAQLGVRTGLCRLISRVTRP